MPGPRHNAIIDLLRSRPELLLLLLGEPTDGATFESVSEDLSAAVAPERRADLVILVRGALRMVVLVEAQGDPDPDKPYRWPLYAITARDRLRLPVALIVIALSEEAAAWARVPIWLGPNGWFTPIVFGPSDLRALPPGGPALEAIRAIANAHRPEAADLARHAIHAASALDPWDFGRYIDLILSSLPASLTLALESWMHQRWEPQSDYIRRHWLAGREEGLEEGREEGLERGREDGRRQSILQLGELRWGPPAPRHAQALAHADTARIDALFLRVLAAASWDELLSP